MKVQKYKHHGTPLNERIRYFFEVMFWAIVTLFVFIILLVAFLKISEVFVPTSRYVGDAAFAEDRRLCLEMRPDSELFACLSEYGWFEKSSVSKLGD